MTKEDWQLEKVLRSQRYESSSAIRKSNAAKRQKLWGEHKASVERALSEGKPVPAEVLADYPDLAKKYAPAQVADVAPTAPRTDFSGNWFVEDDGTGKRIDFKNEKAMRKWLETKTGNAPAQAAEQVAESGGVVTPAWQKTLTEVSQEAQTKLSKYKMRIAEKAKAGLGKERGVYVEWIDPQTKGVSFRTFVKPSDIGTKEETFAAAQRNIIREQHKQRIVEALDKGESVAPRVLFDYPELAEKYGVDIELFKSFRNAADAQLRGIDPLISVSEETFPFKTRYGLDVTEHTWSSHKVNYRQHPEADVIVYKTKSGWIAYDNVAQESLGKKRLGVGWFGFETPEEAAENFAAKKWGSKSQIRNAPDATLRGIDPYAQHGDARQAIQRLRQVANENEDATRILSRDEMLKSKARTQADMYEALLNLWEREDVKRVRLGTDAENRVMAWMRKDVFSSMDEMRMAATVAADWMDNAVMISRDGETYADTALGVLSPFQFWGTRYALQSARRVADYPARLRWYLMLREAQDQVQDDPRFPKRLRGMMNIPIRGVPSWARGEMWFAPLESATSIEQTFRLNQFDDALTDTDIANNIRALASSGEIDPKEAANAIANKSGALWEQTKMRLEELGKRTEGLDAVTDVFRPHLPFDIAWKVMTGNANEIGVLFPMTRLIRAGTSLLPKGSALNPQGQGTNIEQPIKAGLRQLTGARDVPDWDMWELYRTDRALADLVGEGTITERDALLAMIERRGQFYEMAQQRAQEQMRGQSFSVFGGQMYPEGEREYYKARILRDQLLDQEVAKLGANPQDLSASEKWDLVRANGLTKRGTPLGKFNLDNPVLGARSDAYAEPEQRLKGYLTDEMWTKYNALSALDKRTARNGNKELAAFIANPERNYTDLTIDQMAAWVKYLRGYTPEADITPKIGNIPQIGYADPNQSVRYQGILDNQAKLFNMDALQPKLDARAKLTPNDKRAYDAVNPDVAAYMKWYATQMRANPDISKLIRPDTQAAYQTAYDSRVTNNILTRNIVSGLNDMARKIGDSSPRRFNAGRNPMNPTKPLPTTPMQLSPQVKAALQQKRRNAKYYIPRNIYAELLTLFKQYGNGMDFNTWLNSLLQGGQ